ncbi:cysteine hydrolase family protein [Rhodobacter ferrooxidans]|uniref:Isochorismatase hydrolase n=1 Tax=Rhodobacter ferrooxidans TaxID=371731 RepID=C8RZS6_9RHOB|nr:cysteine hydrolase family protein [Rhodobacter sp. SW2]EEW25873.1 isochorismatase hydrolase [Rhodobacter sp. SW2]
MTAALLVIDMQMGMARRSAEGRPRANPQAEDNTAALLALFRARGLPVIHVHHDDPGTPFSKGQPDGEPMPCAQPAPGEAVFWKSTSSAFSGTGLDAHLRKRGIDRLVLIGAVAAFCVTSTTRAASDLGFQVILPGDALIGFDIPAHDAKDSGGRIDADTVLRVTLSLLGADFAQLVTTAEVASVI